MTNSNMINQTELKYVEVINDPLHVELFKNEFIRLYNASLSPGTATMFHRHCEDTIYVVHEGGEISTEIYPGSQKSPTSFPRSFRFYKKILMAIRLVVSGSIKLPKALFFCILSKDQPIVHRAISSEKNLHNMELMGVEIARRADHNNDVSLNGKLYKKEYENDDFCIFRFRLKPGHSENQVFGFPGLMIATNGRVEYEDINSTHASRSKLKSGAYCWHDLGMTRTLINKGEETFEALIIALK